MSRLTPLLLALAATASPLAAAPAPMMSPVPMLGTDIHATLMLERLARAFDVSLVPAAVVEQLVAVQIQVRNTVHAASDRLAQVSSQLAETLNLAIPDLTVLTVDPIAAMGMEESSGFGWRDDPIRHDRRYHRGTDFRAKPGTEVLAAGDGQVVFAGRQGGYGNVIYVDHGGGLVTRYAHLSRIDTKKDAMIMAGQQIGRVGSTGRTTGPHLHFEIRLDDRAVDPVTAMAVADLEREAPLAGRLAAFSLSPELQAKARDTSDEKKAAHAKTRPERANRGKRSQVLW